MTWPKAAQAPPLKPHRTPVSTSPVRPPMPYAAVPPSPPPPGSRPRTNDARHPHPHDRSAAPHLTPPSSSASASASRCRCRCKHRIQQTYDVRSKRRDCLERGRERDHIRVISKHRHRHHGRKGEDVAHTHTHARMEGGGMRMVERHSIARWIKS